MLFAFVIVLALTLNIGFTVGDISDPTHHNVYELFAAIVVSLIATVMKFGDRSKHASWLNMVEIEIGVLVRQCLDRQIGDHETLTREITTWQRQRNQEAARIRRLFVIEQARQKLDRLYPKPQTVNLPLPA